MGDILSSTIFEISHKIVMFDGEKNKKTSNDSTIICIEKIWEGIEIYKLNIFLFH